MLALAICATVGPTVVLSGASVAITKKYRVQLWLGWVLAMIGMGVQSTLHADSSLASQVGLPILTAIGLGIIYAATYFPVLAPLPLAENAHALALFAFSRSFGAVSTRHHSIYFSPELSVKGLGCHHWHCSTPKRTGKTSPGELPLEIAWWCCHCLFRYPCHSQPS